MEKVNTFWQLIFAMLVDLSGVMKGTNPPKMSIINSSLKE